MIRLSWSRPWKNDETMIENNTNEVMTIENLSLKYDKKKDDGVDALMDVNLSIRKGDFVCLLGPSGCGKSTLLNIMAGLLEPTDGKVLMFGREVRGVDWRRAVVFQTPTLYPWLSTHDNVAFGPTVRGIAKAEVDDRTRKYLELVGLSEFGDHKPYELSGGMRQRAALARALVNDPYMILMDEPFGALDALTRTNMQALVRKIWMEDQNTVFLITHDVDEALELGTKVVVMSSRPGRIMNEFEIDFTYQVNEGNDEVRYTEEYIDLRRLILAKIHGQ